MKKTIISALLILPLAGVTTLAGCKKSGEDPPAPLPPPVKVTAITLDKPSATLAAGATLQLAVQSVAPADATDKTYTWGTLHPVVATVSTGGLVTINATAADGATASITATANDGSGITATCTVSVEGAMINGVVWARTNVTAFRTFAATSAESGLYYQWGRNTAWPSTGAVTGWNTEAATGNEWLAANDPCPENWRIPSVAEFETLLDTDRVTSEWVPSPVTGRTFTARPSGPTIFMAATGFRNYTDGAFMFVGQDGQYWSQARYIGHTTTSSHYFFLNKDGASMSYYHCTAGQSVRCVKPQS